MARLDEVLRAAKPGQLFHSTYVAAGQLVMRWLAADTGRWLQWYATTGPLPLVTTLQYSAPRSRLRRAADFPLVARVQLYAPHQDDPLTSPAHLVPVFDRLASLRLAVDRLAEDHSLWNHARVEASSSEGIALTFIVRYERVTPGDSQCLAMRVAMQVKATRAAGQRPN